jgi:hypothetical protein
MSEIEKIYYNMDKLSDDFTELPETEKASEQLYNLLGKDFVLKHEDVITDLTSANEKQGFIYGFRYAVGLLMDGKQVGNYAE